jgi:hypothetical protein
VTASPALSALGRHRSALALAVLVTGIAMGGLTNEPSARPPQQYEGYTVLAADFHVHSFPDGLPAWEAAREARRRRLDAIALTSHNSMVSWHMWLNAPWKPSITRDLVVLPGEELTSAGYHAAIVGLTSTVPWRQPMAAASAAAHAQGAVMILAHPAGDALTRVMDDEGLRSLDGVEAAHPGMTFADKIGQEFRNNYERARALNPRAAAIGSSDFHYFGPIGACRTFVFVRDATAAGILEAVRAGRTVACGTGGEVIGPAGLAPAVAARCREEAAAPADGDTAASRAGTAMAWIGLLALVVFGPPARQGRLP